MEEDFPGRRLSPTLPCLPGPQAPGRRVLNIFGLLGTVGLVVLQVGCRPAPPPPTADKIPITTSSDSARSAYLLGRDLEEKLRFSDAVQHYTEAVELDGDFALAHFGLATTSTTAAGLFENLRRAVELADKASAGEAHVIRAFEAAVNSQPEVQREHLVALVAMYPEDERAHNFLGRFYHNRQEWQEAIAEYRRALEINPRYSPPYNLLGYALRFLGDFSEAEKAFKTYIQLIPDEPNPYDSYAELLLQMGRYKDSIDTYQKALDINPNFSPSYVGMGNGYLFLGQAEEARKVFTKLRFIARSETDKRQAMGWIAISYLHQGDRAAAAREFQARLEMSSASGDFAAVAGDLNVLGEILLDAGQVDEALAKFREAMAIIEGTSLTEEAKEANRRNFLRYSTRVSLARGDIGAAKDQAEEYQRQTADHQVPGEIRLSHELQGLIALAEKRYTDAAGELEQANQQDPRVLYLKALAYFRAGDIEAAREPASRAARFNAISFNYALVRSDAEALVARLENP